MGREAGFPRWREAEDFATIRYILRQRGGNHFGKGREPEVNGAGSGMYY